MGCDSWRGGSCRSDDRGYSRIPLMWNRQNLVQWALGLMLTASVSIGALVWQNYKGKLDTATEKIEVLKSEREDLRLQLAKCEIGHDALANECEDLRDRNRSLERQIRWRR